jgi:hypothetical protein
MDLYLNKIKKTKTFDSYIKSLCTLQAFEIVFKDCKLEIELLSISLFYNINIISKTIYHKKKTYSTTIFL